MFRENLVKALRFYERTEERFSDQLPGPGSVEDLLVA